MFAYLFIYLFIHDHFRGEHWPTYFNDLDDITMLCKCDLEYSQVNYSWEWMVNLVKPTKDTIKYLPNIKAHKKQYNHFTGIGTW